MKLAIHQEPGTFSDRWIPYCQENDISYVIVDCYASDIVEQLREVNCLLWHWHLADSGSHLFARQLTASVEAMGIHVFTNSTTSWHYDDKIAQKYLFEALAEFDNSDRQEFIQFVTGSSKVPVEGFKGLRGTNGVQKFTVVRIPSKDQSRLP